MINIYLCEDERSQLKYFVNRITEFVKENDIQAEIVSAQTNPLMTLYDVQTNGTNPALFILDVDIKGASLDGFELAKRIKGLDLQSYIVFLTSHEELAYKAFECKTEPLEYIIKKPEYFLERSMSKQMQERMIGIFEKIGQRQERKRNQISIVTGSRVIEASKDEILYIEAVKGTHHIDIFMQHRKISIRQSLKYMNELLGEVFISISRSCIVNKDKIREIDKREKIVYVEGGYVLPVSGREMAKLNQFFR